VISGFEPRSGQTKDCKIGMCCFTAKHAALRRTSKDWLARNQDRGIILIQTAWTHKIIVKLCIYHVLLYMRIVLNLHVVYGPNCEIMWYITWKWVWIEYSLPPAILVKKQKKTNTTVYLLNYTSREVFTAFSSITLRCVYLLRGLYSFLIHNTTLWYLFSFVFW
jgi:hypothetical protein